MIAASETETLLISLMALGTSPGDEIVTTPTTRANMPVCLYGQPADMDEINAVTTCHCNIPVIEDAAQSFDAECKGRKSCNLSTIGRISFFPQQAAGLLRRRRGHFHQRQLYRAGMP